MKFRKLLAVAGIAAWSAISAHAASPSYPDSARSISVVVPFGPGSGTDVITRIITADMSKELGGASIIVVNKPGANGLIGAEYAARATPDGYTLLVATNSTNSANPWLFQKLPYDPRKDFAPIGLMTINPLALLVKHGSPFRTPADLVDYAKKHPGKLSYGYGNTGGQVAAAMLLHMADINATAVPYKTTPQLFTDLINGQVDFGFVDFAASRPMIDGGQLNSLATTSEEQLSFASSMPTMKKTPGLDQFNLYAWLGLMAPAGTSPEIVERLNVALNRSLNKPDVKKQLENQTSSVLKPMTTPEFQNFLAEQSELWKRRIQDAGIKPQ